MNLRTQVTCHWWVLKVNEDTIEKTYGNAYMVCERPDDGPEPKDRAKCAKESGAVPETGDLRNYLYHRNDYVSATTITREENRVRTHAIGAHPAHRSPDDQLLRIL